MKKAINRVAGLMAAALASLAQAAPPGLPDMGFEQPEAKAWVAPGGGSYRATRDEDHPFEGKASERLEFVGKTGDATDFGALSRAVPASGYLGKRVRLTGAVRTTATGAAWAGLWMRIDRPGGVAFIDNMHDRPIRNAEWGRYEIEADVPPDATRIVFGLLLQGAGAAWLDDVSLAVIGTAAPVGATGIPATATMREVLASAGSRRTATVPGDRPAHPPTARGMANLVALARSYGYAAHFDATDEAAATDWPAVAIEGVEAVENAPDARSLAAALNRLLRPHAPDFCVFVDKRAAECPAPSVAGATGAVAWRHHGRQLWAGGIYQSARVPSTARDAWQIETVTLGGGVSAHLPLAAAAGPDGKTLARSPEAPAPSAKPDGWTPAGFDRSTRLADVIVAWNIFQHFYPYFDVEKVDWAAVLRRALAAAATDPDDRAFARTLRRMVAALKDGHGNVLYGPPPQGSLPIAWDWIEDRLVVTALAKDGAGGLAVGDVIETIGGEPAARVLSRAMEEEAGSAQWSRRRAMTLLLRGAPGAEQSLGWSRGGAHGTASLAYGNRLEEPRPVQFADLGGGILYVDPARISPGDYDAAGARLAAASGVVFDLRGYPSGPPDFLSHLADSPFKSMPMLVPVVTRPDRAGWTWDESEWDMPPLKPRYARAVFLADDRAVSYAESVLQTVKGAKLGPIVGSPSAGANGNINPFRLPGGYVVIWTGMKVLNADRSLHHGIGVVPDVPVRRTIAGVRAGRDELLEAGIATLRARGQPSRAKAFNR